MIEQFFCYFDSICFRENDEIMYPNTKRCNDFVNAYNKAYPDLKKVVELEKVWKLWNSVKNDLSKY